METLFSNPEGRFGRKLPPSRSFVKVNPAEISPWGSGLLVDDRLGCGFGFDGDLESLARSLDGLASLVFAGFRDIFGLVDHRREGGDLLALTHAHDDDALRRTAE